MLDPISQTLLAAQNGERGRLGLPLLHWDSELAAGAGYYGRTLASLGQLQHSSRQSRPGQGENLWMGTRGAYTPERMVGSWLGERRWFRPGTFPNVSTTGNWFDVGHYSQIIWPTTTRVGCAITSTLQWDYLVCRYAPAGNVDGRSVP